MVKPDPYAVQRLMREYPALDYLMAETLLSFTEEELAQFMREADEKKAEAKCIQEVNEEPYASGNDYQAADQQPSDFRRFGDQHLVERSSKRKMS